MIKIPLTLKPKFNVGRPCRIILKIESAPIETQSPDVERRGRDEYNRVVVGQI